MLRPGFLIGTTVLARAGHVFVLVILESFYFLVRQRASENLTLLRILGR